MGRHSREPDSSTLLPKILWLLVAASVAAAGWFFVPGLWGSSGASASNGGTARSVGVAAQPSNDAELTNSPSPSDDRGSENEISDSPEPEAPPEPPVAAFPTDVPANEPGAGPCIEVRVTASMENHDLLKALAAAYVDKPRDVNGHCVEVAVQAERSGLVAERISKGFEKVAKNKRPTMWVPDSSVWLAAARANSDSAAAIVPAEGEAFASTAVVIAMPQEAAYARDWVNNPPTWQDFFIATAQPDPHGPHGDGSGEFRYGKISPLVATSGLLTLVTEFGIAAGAPDAITSGSVGAEAIIEQVRNYELSVNHYMATPQQFFWHTRDVAGGDAQGHALSATTIDEVSVWNYNRGLTSSDGITVTEGEPPADRLVPIYPSDGTYQAVSVAVGLSGDWISDDQRAAANDFINFLGTAEGQRVVRNQGFRDLNGEVGDGPAEIGQYSDEFTALREPTAEIALAVQNAFQAVRKRAKIVFLVDVSGSMGNYINPQQTRLDAAKDAVKESISYFSPEDEIGLAAFSNYDQQGITPGTLAPVKPIGESLDKFFDATDQLRPVSQTPLYRAVIDYATAMSEDADPNKINAIILLSDGINDTSDRTEPDEMIAALRKINDSSSPVMIFSLAYSDDADAEMLQKISLETGAHYYDATDPEQIAEVLDDLITSF